ncbi:MAG: methyltransferase domain-containing protein [Spirochaetales bacterium]|nr:methyltransferase domain-containing protein [Spirochaetales bacterium]
MERELRSHGERKILFVPAVKHKQGTGHLKRSLTLLKKLGNRAYLYIPGETSITDEVQNILNGEKNIIRRLDKNEEWAMVILDKMATGKEEFAEYCSSGTVIGVDEGGVCRKYFPYLADTVLNPLQKIKPNISLAFCYNNRTIKKDMNSFKNVLLSFGGEDSHHLTITLVLTLLQKNIFSPGELTIVEGPLFKQYQWPEGIKVIKNPPDMAALIPAYDLVFTHFGMTCFESITSGVPVILFNPTSYHQKLSDFYHLPGIGMRKPGVNRIKHLLSHPEVLKKALNTFLPGQQCLTIFSLLQSMNPRGNSDCPVCRRTQNRVIQRFAYRTYFMCKSCHIVYSQSFKDRQVLYDKNYFFYEYKKQYMKTYLEDFDSIKQLARQRLAIIKKIKGKKKFLLDIGCAYGPFLAAAREQGFIPEGMDISTDASAYVNNTLHIQCQCIDFSSITDKETGDKKYDVITMWYVLEHFIKTDIVLKRINRYMKRGGVFAFSTPNICGISYKKNRKKYLENNPGDHYTLWNPASAAKVLKSYGFSIVRIRITGHHPERFPIMNGKGVKNKKGLLFSFLFLISRIFHLGDTFEVYARKVAQL